MTCEPTPPALTDEQQTQICGILTVGCDRQTAANYVGCKLAAIRNQMRRDSAFLARVLRAEASAEFNHMCNVQESAKGKKDWRASVWWLERRSPERFARRDPGTITVRQLKAFIAMLADALANDVTNAADRQRVLSRLQALAESSSQLLADMHASPADSAVVALPTAEDGASSEASSTGPRANEACNADSH